MLVPALIPSLRLLAAIALAVAAAPAAAAACDRHEYAYAGVESARSAAGVAARLTVEASPLVRGGQVAAWVGLGGVDQGPRDSDEWIQVGFSAFADSEDSYLYYEVKRPNAEVAYHQVETGLAPGTVRHVAVVEVPGRLSTWRVLVEGDPVGQPVRLPGSHGTWRPLATAETLAGDDPVCNGFRYRFAEVRIRKLPGAGWTALPWGSTFSSPGYRLQRLGPIAFLAYGASKQ